MATNRIESLDPALIRPGRIDRKIEFPLPGINTTLRNSNIKMHLKALIVVVQHLNASRYWFHSIQSAAHSAHALLSLRFRDYLFLHPALTPLLFSPSLLDIKTKRNIFKIHTGRMSLSEDVDLEVFVMSKDDLSGMSHTLSLYRIVSYLKQYICVHDGPVLSSPCFACSIFLNVNYRQFVRDSSIRPIPLSSTHLPPPLFSNITHTPCVIRCGHQGGVHRSRSACSEGKTHESHARGFRQGERENAIQEERKHSRRTLSLSHSTPSPLSPCHVCITTSSINLVGKFYEGATRRLSTWNVIH